MTARITTGEIVAQAVIPGKGRIAQEGVGDFEQEGGVVFINKRGYFERIFIAGRDFDVILMKGFGFILLRCPR
jgi:hypothetical protein